MGRFPGHLTWPDCRNARDLGGLTSSDGRRVAERALVRADCLDRLTDKGIQDVRRYGVSAVIDLRSDWEVDGTPHPFGNDPGYRSIPFIDDARDGERDPSSERTLADLYRGSIDRNGRCIAAATRGIAHAPVGTVLVHCLSGADRTGLLIALVLDALRIDRTQIVGDYDRSHACLAESSRPDPRSAPEQETMQQTLRHLDDRWGGSRSYLAEHGVNADTIDRLADRLLAPGFQC